jgi:hypothetical protein
MVEPVQFNLLVGWSSMIAGALSGAAIGLRFHEEAWMGGYASFRRRMVRLGHIAFFGLGIINVLFAVTLAVMPVAPLFALIGSIGFTIAVATMSACCFLTAWRPSFKALFPIPVAGVLIGISALIAGWIAR